MELCHMEDLDLVLIDWYSLCSVSNTYVTPFPSRAMTELYHCSRVIKINNNYNFKVLAIYSC